jgi:tRNA dimethylallyltransferase
MLDGGFAEEVKSLLDKGYSPGLPTLSAIGYREIVAYLKGEMSLEEAVIQIKRLTRRYVRQQGAWFRGEDETIHWFMVDETTVEAVYLLVKGWYEQTISAL